MHDWQWRPQEVRIDTAMEFVRYLGVDVNLMERDHRSLARAKESISSSCRHLLARIATPRCKLEVLLKQIVPKALYVGSKCSWSLAQYEDLEKPITAALRSILKLGPTFPTDLIYMPYDQCGVGAPSLSDLCQMHKWSSLQNSIAAGGEAERAAEDILSRAYEVNPRINGEYQFAGLHSVRQGVSYLTSLVQWLQRAGLVISRLDPSLHPATVPYDELGFNTSEIDRCAVELGLAPSPLYPDAQLDLACSAIFTDATYVVKKSPLSALVGRAKPLTTHGVGAAAIYFMPKRTQNNLWERSPSRIVRITARDNEVGMDNYAWELIGIAVALRLAKKIPHYIPLFNDCKGAIARAHRAQSYHGRAVAHLNKGVICSSIPVPESGIRRPISHVLGHPERPRKPKTGPTPPPTKWEEWSVKQKGIYIADAAAENKFRDVSDRIGTNVKWSHISLSAILRELVPVGRWHLRDSLNNLPVLKEIKYRVKRYLTCRDGYRTRRGDLPYWEGTHLEFAAYCWDVPSQDKGVWGGSKRAKWILDKCAHGRNLAKGKQGAARDEAARCVLCARQDSQKHMLLECTADVNMMHLRDSARARQFRILQQIERGEKGSPSPPLWMRQSLAWFHRLCWSKDEPEVERLWLGTWTDETLAKVTAKEVADLTDLIDHKERHLFRRNIKKLPGGPRIRASNDEDGGN
ncbi:MAG: hypothetical protein ACK5Y2_00140 [Bdellovibrionales bacterium]